jgi:hypothetical protein
MTVKPVAARSGKVRLPLVIYVLAVGTFVMGTTEFVVAGLLPGIAADYSTTVAGAGLAITVFAVGMIVGAAVMALATIRLSRRWTLGVQWQLCATRPTQQSRRRQRTATIPAGVHVSIVSLLVSDVRHIARPSPARSLETVRCRLVRDCPAGPAEQQLKASTHFVASSLGTRSPRRTSVSFRRCGLNGEGASSTVEQARPEQLGRQPPARQQMEHYADHHTQGSVTAFALMLRG